MAKKMNYIIILALSAMVMSLSSCGSLGYYMGSGQRGGIIGNMLESATGSWYDEYSRCTITVTERANWYTVVDRNCVANAYYLQPLNEAVKCLPGGLQVLSWNTCQPTFRNRDKSLGWLIPTNKGVYKVIKGKYSKVE